MKKLLHGVFLLVWLKEACMPNFSFLGSYFTTSPDGRAYGRLEESKIRLTQPSLAGTGAELGNKTEEAALKYLIKEKDKQKKIANLKYTSLVMQEYLVKGIRDIIIIRVIFKARGRNLEIKTHKKYKFRI